MRFWSIPALLYLVLAVLHGYFGYKLEGKLKKAKEEFKKDYGFRTFGVFELIVQYFTIVKWLSAIGFGLAAIAAVFEVVF